MAEIDHGSYVPVYRQLADILRAQIGELAAGQKVPSETDLMQEYGVARITVRAAMRELRAEGLIATERRRGSYVRGEGDRMPMDITRPAEVSARMPTPQERLDLKIPEGVPLLIVEHEDGEMELLPADRVVLKIHKRD